MSCNSSAHHQEFSTTLSALVYVIKPAHDTATDTEWQLPEVVLTQFLSPDDEHDVLETRTELKMKINTQKRIVRHIGHLPRILIFCPSREKSVVTG
jgi:hypothetical protein